MAITHLQTIASWKGYPIKLFVNGTKKYCVQWLGSDSFIPRGKAIALNGDATLATGVVVEDLGGIEVSDSYGVQVPSSWTTPTGYVAKLATDQTTTYYVSEVINNDLKDTNGDGVIDSLDKQVTTDTTVRATAFLDNPWQWATENPLYAFVGGIVIYMLIVGVFVKNKKKKSDLTLGLL